MKFVPMGNLALLSQMTVNEDSESTDVLQRFMQKLTLTERGDMLEWCLKWWLQLRVTVVAGESSFSLGTLLGLKAAQVQGAKRDLLCKTTFDVPHEKAREIELPNSYAGEEFLQKLASETLAEGEFVFLQPHPKECFDAGIAVRDDKGVLVVVLDAKSASDPAKQKNNKQIRTLQDRRFAAFAAELTKLQVEPHSLGEAWQNSRVAFIY
eukprot:3696354-Amphidinium_carterae.1